MNKEEYMTPEIVPLGTVVGKTLNSGGSCQDGNPHPNSKALPPGRDTCPPGGN